MREFIKYITSMIVGNLGLALMLWLPVMLFCCVDRDGFLKIHEAIILYLLVYVITFVVLIFLIKPYSEWVGIKDEEVGE